MPTTEQIHARAVQVIKPDPVPEPETPDNIAARIPKPLAKPDPKTGAMFATPGAAGAGRR